MSSSSRPGRPVPPSRLLEVGRIEKVHGLRGEVVVGLVTNMVDARTSVGTVLWSGGEPFVITGARPHKNKWLMSFDGVSGREAAESLRGRTLEAEPLDADAIGSGPDNGEAGAVVAFVHELIGGRLIDQHGTDHGPVVSVIDNPASDLMELADGRLVPLTFYRHHDGATITVEVPPGLLDDDPDDSGR